MIAAQTAIDVAVPMLSALAMWAIWHETRQIFTTIEKIRSDMEKESRHDD